MTNPARLRLSRQKGEDLQFRSKLLNGLECVPVGRPSRYANPHRIDLRPLGPNITQADAVRLFEDSLERMDIDRRETYLAPLRGKNLACWCALTEPCHADVLLKWAAKPAIPSSITCVSCEGTGSWNVITHLPCQWCQGEKVLDVPTALRFADQLQGLGHYGYIEGDHDLEHSREMERKAADIYQQFGQSPKWKRRSI